MTFSYWYDKAFERTNELLCLWKSVDPALSIK